MKLSFVHGSPHKIPHAQTSANHIVRIRLGVGLGTEAFDCRLLKETIWPAGAIEYIPPGIEYLHTTYLEADRISVEIEHNEWLEITSKATFGCGLLRCDAGYRHEHVDQLVQSIHRTRTPDHIEADYWQEELGLSVFKAYQVANQRTAPRSKQASLSPVVLKRLADLVESSINGNVGLTDMAQEAQLSRFHFTAVFQRTTGSTPYQYVLHRKLMRAQKLLRDTVSPITTVALDCGFSSHAHLSSAFSQRFGISPMMFRNSPTPNTLRARPVPLARSPCMLSYRKWA